MEEAGPSSRGQKRRDDGKRSLQEIALPFINRDGNKATCRIEENSGCTYAQTTMDVGNFIRHFRTKHTDAAKNLGLLKTSDASVKKPRVTPKRPIAIDIPLYMDSIIKLVTYHQLPLCFVEWDGMKQLIDPISSALGVTVNRSNIKMTTHSVADRIRIALTEEMRNKLISLKIDSASRFNRHVLGINVQYFLEGKIAIRTLGKCYL